MPGPSKLEKVVDPIYGSGSQGPLPGSTTFSNFDGPGIISKKKKKMQYLEGKIVF